MAIKVLCKILILVSLPCTVNTIFAEQPQLSKPALNPVISAPQLSSKSYLLIDYNSGRILAESNIDARIEPASITKMLTMYAVDSEIKNNKLSRSDLVHVSENANSTPGSRMFIEQNTKVSVDDLIKGIIIQSGNDASIALAEHIAGSEASFADLMNGYAKLLGMQNSNFTNVTGLPKEDHYTTTRDLAKLSIALIKDFPESYAIYAEKDFTYGNIKQNNRNRLLWKNDKVDGIKTGHTEAAGFCLVASALDNNMRLIAIVVGAKDDNTRTIEANKLLTWGFRFFETHKIYAANVKVKDTNVWLGKANTLDLGLKQDLYVTIRHGEYNKLQAELDIPEIIKAPVKLGQPLGNYRIKLDQNVIAEMPLIALNEISEGNIFSRVFDNIKLTTKTWLGKFNL
jgi:serine-type D-Ala-D-Ala carboxypeptidase (penicillin-binding protein 5/6)